MRKENKRSLKVKFAIGTMNFVLFIILALMIFSIFMGPNALRVKNGIYHRNLDFCTWLLKDNKAPLQKDGIPVSRLTPWDSELPALIEYDIEYSKKHGYNMQYTFNGNNINIEFNDGEPKLSIARGLDCMVGLTTAVTNFSMYFVEDDLVIYGFDNTLEEGFATTTINGNDEKGSYTGFFYRLTYNFNIPFNVNPSIGIIADNIGDYTVYVHQDEPEKTTFWKDGEEVNTITFPGKVKYNEPSYGFLLTDENEMYVSYLQDNTKPYFDYSYVGTIDSIINEQHYMIDVFCVDSFKMLYESEGYNVSIPIFIINDEYYTICPEDWDTYMNYSTASEEILSKRIENPNYKVKFIKLEDCFDSAEFYFNRNNWISYIKFDINAKKFQYLYVVDGYDWNINISEINDDIIENKQKTVYTIDDFWDHLEEIRNMYKQYYDYRPEER